MSTNHESKTPTGSTQSSTTRDSIYSRHDKSLNRQQQQQIKRFSSYVSLCHSMQPLDQNKLVKTSSSLVKRFSQQSESELKPALKKHTLPTTMEHQLYDIGQKVSVVKLNVVGTVRYIGNLAFSEKKNDVWVGIELDIEGSGKNDGCIQGTRYFTCAPYTGLFVLSTKVVAYNPDRSKSSLKRKSMIMSSTSLLKRPLLNPSKSARIATAQPIHQKPLSTRSSPSETDKTQEGDSNQKQTLSYPSTKSTRQPLLKKSASLSTRTSSDDNSRYYHRNSKQSIQRSHSEARMDTVDELKRVQVLLQQSREEKRLLLEKMDGKEEAWTRLLTAKESYALRVQEKEDEIVRLNNALQQAQQATEELAKANHGRDAIVSRLNMSEEIQKQHIRAIERLEGRLVLMQQQHTETLEQRESTIRDQAATIDQLYKQIGECDQATLAIERECADLRQAHISTMQAYDETLDQLKKEHAITSATKDVHIHKLQRAVNDFHQIYPVSPITVIADADDERASPQKRLEDQLELATTELDHKRELVRLMAVEIDQLKDEIKRLHRLSATSNAEFYALRTQLETEIEDKRRVMDEANAAIQQQEKTEEENQDLRLSLTKTQLDLADALKNLTVSHQNKPKREFHYLLDKNRALKAECEAWAEEKIKLEHECRQLEDQMTVRQVVCASDHACQRNVEILRLQLAREVKCHNDLKSHQQIQVDKLKQEIQQLESLIESKVLQETELENLLEDKLRISFLETKLRQEEKDVKKLTVMPLSPASPSTFRRSFSLMPTESTDSVDQDVYCEICEEYGHEVMACTALNMSSKQEDTSSLSCYCVNCDVFGEHPTEACPNHDETF
ncbi:hypothetical protein CU098_011467 [Rhizopus stolonifer]|uniref:CAP-Gly domain-containing protein n=1 Tax=Rhizopus stolonifer TaxID=4846 RepID=A0A367KPV5_RHIST|nr:hypothetical protein CU098_011467 [Rhizopus stolonifer]